jgi:hypothetical protein
MRTLLTVVAAVGVLGVAGCDALKKKKPTAATKADETTVARGPGGGVVVNAPAAGGGGGGGAVSAVRKAVDRTKVRAALTDIRLTIEGYEVSNMRMPTPAETLQLVRQAAPQYAKLIDDGDVVLVAARTRQDVWAYEGKPPGNNYLVLTNQGVEDMDGATLRQRLGQ